MNFKGKVNKHFIDRRNQLVAEDTRTSVDPYFQWDCEFVEYHQCKVDMFQTQYDGYEYDTVHEHLGNIDYKLYRGSDGTFHVSPYIQKHAANGTIDMFAIWMWNGRYKGPLKVGQTVEYTILDYVDAKYALQFIDENNRIPYPLPEKKVEEEVDVYDILRELPDMSVKKAQSIAIGLLQSWQPKKITGKTKKDQIIRDIENACTSLEICSTMYNINFEKEGLGTVGSAWQSKYKDI